MWEKLSTAVVVDGEAIKAIKLEYIIVPIPLTSEHQTQLTESALRENGTNQSIMYSDAFDERAGDSSDQDYKNYLQEIVTHSSKVCALQYLIQKFLKNEKSIHGTT